jgi:predicted RNA-binding Zn-ribbon protein involved in translation (DUF1610 family)
MTQIKKCPKCGNKKLIERYSEYCIYKEYTCQNCGYKFREMMPITA